jgi:hypothetical protein
MIILLVVVVVTYEYPIELETLLLKFDESVADSVGDPGRFNNDDNIVPEVAVGVAVDAWPQGGNREMDGRLNRLINTTADSLTEYSIYSNGRCYQLKE